LLKHGERENNVNVHAIQKNELRMGKEFAENIVGILHNYQLPKNS
jgi:hypothetical protein